MKTSKRLYQWDVNQHFESVAGKYVDYVVGNQVYRVAAANGNCAIPDELLKISGNHIAYECFDDGTKTEVAFTVAPRPLPPDYVYTPTQKITFDSLVQKVNDAVDDLSWDNLANKPFGEVTKTLNVSGYETYSQSGVYVSRKQMNESDPFVYGLIVGETYTLTLNGQVHTSVAKSINGIGYIGDINIVYGQTSEIGFCFFISLGMLVLYSADAPSGTITLKGTDIETLDIKYVPQSLKTKLDETYESVQNKAESQDMAERQSVVHWKGKTYSSSSYKDYFYVLTDKGLWDIHWVSNSKRRFTNIPSYVKGNTVMVKVTSSTGLMEVVVADDHDPYIDYEFSAYLRNSNGTIIERHSDVSSLTLGKIDKNKMNYSMVIRMDNAQYQPMHEDTFDDFNDIPVPTSADNGKVLGVVNGKIAWVNT